MTKLLKIEHLTKRYSESSFKLENISLSIDSSETVGLIGKNGSGKSTLINILVGNRHKDSGNIEFFEQPLTKDMSYKEEIGVVFDDLRVPNKLTVTEVNKIFEHIYQSWDSNRYFDLIQHFDLPKDTKLSTFSRGMRMKIALSVAMSHHAKLLILDEATAGMDISGREEVLELLEMFVEQGGGILISSHISEDIEQLADKLVFMKDGKIILTERKDELLAKYGIVTTDSEEISIPEHTIIASRSYKGQRQILVNDTLQVFDAQPLTHIDDATKIMMRGDV
ncbi:ABC transporter ATP-binding protein [Staphylococcus simiae]|uniref:ABC transporter, ATP-binding protein n=1 Tax=Staphylococcus simiae CCM 7213 = CCUG 51256 TaxID=911238 RepID=G5JHM1_9STAP|nr:ABC transporter ATP-binding protein [Staphylococcus simiae]EHJ08327.1 ABC transporter, ATP-binding protein [Staphylococcus simiae CCM 7213 = CCUG 51256]PNZ09430.1 ABC transporter ATP-binding protein [Staphylococcus simiae]SNV60139.1 ABC transporter ATP-binding protein [Staphylococcus simiae]